MPFNLKSPNPDMNGIKIDGYDRVEKKNGFFTVHDSNHAAKLQSHPHNFVIVPNERASPAPARKTATVIEDKKLEVMTKSELTEWLTERGEGDLDALNKTDLLALAQAKAEEIAKKSAAAQGT